MKKTLLFAAALSLFAGAALAQTPTGIGITTGSPTTVSNLNGTDLIPNVPLGAPTASPSYSTPGKIAGMEAYSYQSPVTAFTITVPNGISFLYLNPAGTLATGTLTMPASAGDGQRFCLQDTQTQTAITISANTNQSLGGLSTPTALVAGTRYCWFYNLPLATWLRYV